MGSIKKAFDLTGKTALVTGGSRGLGLQIEEALGEQGARIVLSSRKADDLKQAQEHLAGQGVKADWIAADNAKDDDIKRLADEAIAKPGKWTFWSTTRARRGALPPKITPSRPGTS
jgi:NAD(P)-dependent dehydrogenase (short-subunit alcohol dehydrogenase family)